MLHKERADDSKIEKQEVKVNLKLYRRKRKQHEREIMHKRQKAGKN